MDSAEEVALLHRLALAVQAAVKEGPFERFGAVARMGADGTDTKFVDDLAERAMLRVLAENGNPWNVLSEEAGFLDFGRDRLLVADPVDGTRNTCRGIPFSCVALALGTKTLDDVDVGLVLNLATGDTFTAIKGQGARLNGRPIRCPPLDTDDTVVATTLGKEARPEALHLVTKRYNVRSLGAAALEMALVASGGLDFYYYGPNKLRIMDIAASTLIVREAGGFVHAIDGSGDLRMDLSLVPRTSLVAAGSREAMDILKVIR